jgi:hypothetical protein
VIISSVAIMNDSYLRSKSDAQKLYVMCHELGHGFGLPHRDELTWNRDLGSCLDYTNNYPVNMRPDNSVDFANLSLLYGTFVDDTNRGLGIAGVDDLADITETTRWNYTKGRLLYQSKQREVYQNDLGNGINVITTLLKILDSDD